MSPSPFPGRFGRLPSMKPLRTEYLASKFKPVLERQLPATKAFFTHLVFIPLRVPMKRAAIRPHQTKPRWHEGQKHGVSSAGNDRRWQQAIFVWSVDIMDTGGPGLQDSANMFSHGDGVELCQLPLRFSHGPTHTTNTGIHNASVAMGGEEASSRRRAPLAPRPHPTPPCRFGRPNSCSEDDAAVAGTAVTARSGTMPVSTLARRSRGADPHG